MLHSRALLPDLLCLKKEGWGRAGVGTAAWGGLATDCHLEQRDCPSQTSVSSSSEMGILMAATLQVCHEDSVR